MGDVCEVELSEVGVDGANSVVDDGGEPTQSRIVAKAATPVGVDGDNADDVDWVPQSSGPRCCGCSDACLNTAIPFIGNVLEWFDFSVFGYMTSFLSEAFFPSVDPVAATMSTFTVFAGAFLMRPVGGLIFGHIGDTIGRKRALLSSIILMAVATTAMACLPTYAQAGIAAPVLLTIVRLLQGISIGGQLVGTFVHAVETAPADEKVRRGAYTFAAASVGTCLGSAVAATLEAVLDHDSLVEWGWRIPFGLGLFVGIFTIVFRDRIHEPKAIVVKVKNPIKVAFSQHCGLMVRIMAVIGFNGASFYFIVIWLSTFLDSLRFPSVPQAFTINTVLLAVHVVLFHFLGKCIDRSGHMRRWIAVGVLVVGMSCPPMMSLLDLWDVGVDVCANQSNVSDAESLLEGIGRRSLQDNSSVAAGSWCERDDSHDWQLVLITIFAQGFLLAFQTLAMTAVPTWIVSQFRSEIRYSAVAISYNFAQAIFSGTTPLVATALLGAASDQCDGVTVCSRPVWLAGLWVTALMIPALVAIAVPELRRLLRCRSPSS